MNILPCPIFSLGPWLNLVDLCPSSPRLQQQLPPLVQSLAAAWHHLTSSSLQKTHKKNMEMREISSSNHQFSADMLVFRDIYLYKCDDHLLLLIFLWTTLFIFRVFRQLRLVVNLHLFRVYPIIYKVLYFPDGAGFLPSTVCFIINFSTTSKHSLPNHIFFPLHPPKNNIHTPERKLT